MAKKTMMKMMYKDKPNSLIYKTVDFEQKGFREDDDYFYFEGYLSTFGNVDRGQDVVVKGAFADSLSKMAPSLLWGHKSEDPPVGIFEKVYEDDIGLYVHGKMPKDDDFVKKRLIPQMKIKSIKSMSIGYSVPSGGSEYKNGIRYLKKIDLWEGSLVTIPMNPEANLKSASGYQSDIKVADRDYFWNELAAIGRIREWAGADGDGLIDPEVQEKYKMAFLWYDQEDPQVFSSYKLPIMDIVDGELALIPRAVFSAALKLRGGEGGVWFWFEQDRPTVMRTVEKYYEKIGLESPFGKNFRIDDFKAHDERELEDLFHNGACVSKKSAKTLVSILKSKFDCDDQIETSVDADKNVEELNSILSDIKSLTNEIGGI